MHAAFWSPFGRAFAELACARASKVSQSTSIESRRHCPPPPSRDQSVIPVGFGKAVESCVRLPFHSGQHAAKAEIGAKLKWQDVAHKACVARERLSHSFTHDGLSHAVTVLFHMS